MKITNEVMTDIFEFCWLRIKSEDEQFKDIEKPAFVPYTEGMPQGALAAYVPDEHRIYISNMLWAMYPNELTDKMIEDLRDVIYHEMAHILHHDHEVGFWEQTHKFDSTGVKIRKHRQAELEKLKQKTYNAQKQHVDLTKEEKEQKLIELRRRLLKLKMEELNAREANG